jgi:6-phosphogluconolactonase (cycloisomerase 2 family)
VRRSLLSLGTYVLAASLTPCPAATKHVLVNNNNSLGNSVVWYDLNTKTGSLKTVSVLRTGGQGWGGEADLSGVQQAISADARCIFALDLYSSDIAAFSKATGYKRVGNYFNQKLISGAEGDSIALSPDGKFLYANYTRTVSLAAWQVSSDCSLALIAIEGGQSGGPLQVTPNGKYLVTRDGNEFAIDQETGNLTFLGGTTFRSGACARRIACLPYGIQISSDSRRAMFSSFAPDVRRERMVPLMLTAQITPEGLVNPLVKNLTLENDLRLNIFPFMGAAAYKGSGQVYLGVTSGNGQYNAGVLTADFTEKPVKFAITNSTVANPEVGNIAVTGNTLVMAQYPNQISVFRIKKNGSLKLLSTTTLNEQGEGLFSLSIFPNTR